jgi:class 3 adenylate cyclase/tetratricopeptide (TPR) repeat protein
VICTSCGAANRDEARFCDTCGARLDAPLRLEQRKVVTVLFCDVAGSTALGERLDPEALRTVIARYFDVAKAAIERHGGTLEKFIGDAVMAVFGVPTIREDDALRAVRAAQELRDGVEIEVRIGVNTGEVVTSVEDSLVTGDAVNVAARLEQAAAAGEVLLGEKTYRLVRDAVSAEKLPALQVKGKSEPLRAYRLDSVIGDTPYARRLDAPLVGREVERRLLADAWQRTCTERACALFTILGAAGVGKSRLVAEFLAGLDAIVVSGRCLSYGDGITYWPVVEIVRRLLDGADPPSPALAALLGDGQAPAGDIAFAVRKLFEAKAGERPLVVVFDDLQWAEPTLLDLVEECADWIRDAPILLLCLARGELLELRQAWGGGKLNATTVLLEPLTADETDELIDALLAGEGLAPELRSRIRAAAEGNPLFVEQMLAMAHEHDGELVVPSTIQALLAARLDQLPLPERAALERGAVEGQVFHRGAVAALAPDDPDVPTRLLGLVRKELVRPSEALLPGDDAFRFRHLLIRDAAYDALPKATRADLHQRFAAWLAEHGPDVVELDEILGFHLEQAAGYLAELGAPDPSLARAAAERLASAGRRALSRQDNPAAASLLRRAASLTAPQSDDRLRVLVLLGASLYRLGRLAESESVLLAAVDEARAAGNRGAELDADVQLAEVRLHSAPNVATGQTDARRVVTEAIAWGEGAADAERLGRALDFAGRLHFWSGEIAAATEMFERAADVAREAGDVATEVNSTAYLIGCWHIGPMPVDEALSRIETVLARTNLGRAARWRALLGRARLVALAGRLDDANADLAEAEALAGEAHFVVLAMHRADLELLVGDHASAEERFRRVHDVLSAAKDYGHLASNDYKLADAALRSGRVEEALELTRQVAEMAVPEDVDALAGWRRVHAKALARRGELEEAVRLAREASEIAEATEYHEVRMDTADALVEVLRLAGRSEEADAALRRALDLHEQKGDVYGAARLRQALGPPAT